MLIVLGLFFLPWRMTCHLMYGFWVIVFFLALYLLIIAMFYYSGLLYRNFVYAYVGSFKPYFRCNRERIFISTLVFLVTLWDFQEGEGKFWQYATVLKVDDPLCYFKAIFQIQNVQKRYTNIPLLSQFCCFGFLTVKYCLLKELE